MSTVPDPSSARRVVLETEDGKHVFGIERGQRKIIGRREDTADFAIPSDTLSRRHFMIDFTGDHAVVEDLRSACGTALDEALVHRAPLLGGEHLRAGQVRFTVRYES